ncbi:MAG: hypothetical protein WDZ49_05390 [Litorilinea sp.]
MSLLLSATIVLAGCGPRATGGELARSAVAEQVVVDLPALVLDVDAAGQVSLGGVSVAEVGGLVGQDFSALSFPADTVSFLTASDIQHFQIDNTPDGLLILVNGTPIPSLAWDGESLVATAEVLETLGAGIALLDRVLPLVRNLGVGVTIRLPIAEGAEAVPLVVTDSEIAAQAMAAQQEFLDTVGAPPTFQLVVNYADDGTWSVGDLSQEEWSAIAPIPWEMLNLDPALIQGASASGIDEVGVATNPEGIFISVNGLVLPHITWADGRINHVINLAAQTGMLDMVLGENPETSALLDTVQSLLPAVQASDVNIRIVFP